MLSVRRLRLFLRLVPALLLAGGAALAAAADPPARVARLNDVEGSLTYAPAGDNEWTDAQVNRPLTRGDRLWTDRGTRAEFQVGSSAVRLDGQTRLDIVALDDQSAQFSVTGGSVYVRVRSLGEGENFELDTPNLAFRAGAAGDYRIDVDAQQGTTRVTIHAGSGTAFGEGGQPLPLGGGQQVTFRGRALAQVNTQESPPDDAFDRWATERNRHSDQSVAARYVPREVVGYEQLDPHGQWRRTEAYGAVWVPQGMAPGWAPYRQGYWDWIEPWGWTWIDDAPWGFAPFHYGRWTQLDGQWAWVPGRLSVHPVYAPALVAFVGGSATDIAWFPLAPGEAWQPPYAASALYISNVNRNIPLTPVASYAYQRQPDALTAVPLAQFEHGRPTASGWWRVAKNMLTSAPIVTPPLMHAMHATAHAVTAPRALPPAPPGAPQVTAQAAATAAPPNRARAPAAAAAAAVAPAPPAAPAVTAAAKQPEPGRAVRAVATAARPPRQADPPRAAPAPVLSARTAAAFHARNQHATQARLVQTARAAQARHAQLARREATERARRELAARRDIQRRQAQARRDELSRRQARARADEQLRREAHATQIDLARRVADHDAQVLREQRLKREEQARRAAEAQAERDAWERSQQASEPWRRDRLPQDQRLRVRRPDLRQEVPTAPPQWQRGSPLVNVGPTS